MPRIAMRMWAWAAALRILKRIVPLETLVRLMRRDAVRSRIEPEAQTRIETYMNMTGRFPFRPPSNCLERSLVAYRMLCEAAAGPELVIGLKHTADRDLHGHVWVAVDGRPLGERPDALAAYTPIARFDSAGHRHSPSGTGDLLSRMAIE